MFKSSKKMSPMEAKAKLATLKSLMSDMDDMMMDGMKNAKGKMKVSVMANSPEALKEGLEKAEEVVEDSDEMESNIPKFGKPKMSEDEDEMEDEYVESEDSEESEEDLDRKIAELLAKKKARKLKDI
jgi:hypothetical protein